MHLLRLVPCFAMLLLMPATALARQHRLELLDTAVLRSPLLDESSGVAASARRPGIYWTINDSGNRPLLFATDSAGNDLGFVRVAGASAVDWEDLAAGPCPRRTGRCLYIGDIGDNNERRRQVVVYALDEPDPPRSAADTLRVVTVTDSLNLRYPVGAHDAEALVIAPDRWLLLVTKDRSDPAAVFGAPLDSITSGAILRRMAELPIAISMTRGRLVTGAAVSPDGRWLAVRTYISLHLFRFAAGRFVPLDGRNGLTLPVVETQGEGITFEANDRVVLTSERGSSNHAILTRLRLTNLPP